MLEKAVTKIDQRGRPDYGVLLAGHNGLPGDGFFARFKRNRTEKYFAVVGQGTLGSSVTKRRRLLNAERERVFAMPGVPV